MKHVQVLTGVYHLLDWVLVYKKLSNLMYLDKSKVFEMKKYIFSGMILEISSELQLQN